MYRSITLAAMAVAILCTPALAGETTIPGCDACKAAKEDLKQEMEDLYRELNDLDDEVREAEKELAEAKEEQAEALADQDEIFQKIQELWSDISALETLQAAGASSASEDAWLMYLEARLEVAYYQLGRIAMRLEEIARLVADAQEAVDDKKNEFAAKEEEIRENIRKQMEIEAGNCPHK